jgi:signal transduction histidine kinase
MRRLRLPDRWFDVGVAAVLLAAGEIELIARGYAGQQLWLTLGMVTITVPLAWRRRAPLLVMCVVMTALVVLRAISAEFHSLSVPVFALFIPPYTVAAYEPRPRALLGLIVCLTTPVVMHLTTAATGSWAFVIGAPSAMWGAGRLIRRQRMRADALAVKASRITAEHEDRERLALADERSRIARELHAVVAKTVSAMVVQTEAAQRLLDTDAARADEAMASVEHAGRQALGELSASAPAASCSKTSPPTSSRQRSARSPPAMRSSHRRSPGA